MDACGVLMADHAETDSHVNGRASSVPHSVLPHGLEAHESLHYLVKQSAQGHQSLAQDHAAAQQGCSGAELHTGVCCRPRRPCPCCGQQAWQPTRHMQRMAAMCQARPRRG